MINLSSLAFGNELLIDDIISAMERGDDEQNSDYDTPIVRVIKNENDMKSEEEVMTKSETNPLTMELKVDI